LRSTLLDDSSTSISSNDEKYKIINDFSSSSSSSRSSSLENLYQPKTGPKTTKQILGSPVFNYPLYTPKTNKNKG
jgi:hypothetical protein